MKLSQAAIAFTLLVSGAAQGESSLPPPAWPVPDIKPSGTQIQPVTGITLGSLHVTFDNTTFNDVLGSLGKAPIGQQGDAGEFLMWVCYTVPAAHARIWLTSSELGGREYIDGMVTKRLERTETENPLCPIPANKATVASIDNGIWLGETVEKIKSILGAPNRASASVIYYLYEGKDGEFDISSILALKIHNNKVTELHANHSTTN